MICGSNGCKVSLCRVVLGFVAAQSELYSRVVELKPEEELQLELPVLPSRYFQLNVTATRRVYPTRTHAQFFIV